MVGQLIVARRASCKAYIVISLHPDGGMKVATGCFMDQRRVPCTRQTIHGRMSMLRELWHPHPITFDVFACPDVGKRHAPSTDSFLFQLPISDTDLESSGCNVKLLEHDTDSSQPFWHHLLRPSAHAKFGALPKLNLGSVASAFNISERHPNLLDQSRISIDISQTNLGIN